MIENEMTKKALYKMTTCFSMAILSVIVAGCSSEDAVADHLGDGGTFTVTAEVARQIYTRVSDENGYVTGGTYYLAYPKTDNSYNVASVDFNKNPETTPGIGIVTVPENQPLKWINIGGSTPTFYLDNVNPGLASGEGSTATEIVFGEDNPYIASLWKENEDEPSNDLLWGSTEVSNGAKTVNFDLHHRMARVRIQITTDGTYATDDELNLDEATVSISSLVHKPVSYNRLSGKLSLGDSPEHKSLVFKDKDDDWSSTKKDENNSNIKIYTTQDFVLPPQDLLENEGRPKLTITLKNGTEYSGILPHAMEIEDDNPDHTEPSLPAALSFVGEHILTIRTVITKEPPTLSFMPVWVVDWVDKGEFELEAHQSGIYKVGEFYELIGYYNENKEFQLPRYGRLVENESGEEKWVFDFFHSTTLEEEKIRGKMKHDNSKKDFSFSFNNYAQYIKRADGTIIKIDDPAELYRIVTDTSSN